MKITLSVFKADIGSIGGHTKPAEEMLSLARNLVYTAIRNGSILDGFITHTGDDIAFNILHTHGVNASNIHDWILDCFKALTALAEELGMYAAGQDINPNAPSGNVRGAGPGAAELEFELLPKHRPAESILIFTADKCAPGIFNQLLDVYCYSNMDRGLMISQKFQKGFTFKIIDMDYKGEFFALSCENPKIQTVLNDMQKRLETKVKIGELLAELNSNKSVKHRDTVNLKVEFEKFEGDRIIKVSTAEPFAGVKLLAMLRNLDRFGIKAIYSNDRPEEQIVAVTSTRLHNVFGAYTGKDDPAAIVRTQSLFPSPEEVVVPFTKTLLVTGDCRGSHTRSLSPEPINSPVVGPNCNPIISCIALSITREGKFSEHVDLFGHSVWDIFRKRAAEKCDMMEKEQGALGIGMASESEMAYTGIVELMRLLDKRFEFETV